MLSDLGRVNYIEEELWYMMREVLANLLRSLGPPRACGTVRRCTLRKVLQSSWRAATSLFPARYVLFGSSKWLRPVTGLS